MINQNYRIFMLYVRIFCIVSSYTLYFMIFFFQILYSKQIEKSQDSIVLLKEGQSHINTIYNKSNNTHNTLQTYSIINDLRLAFEPYSSIDKQYKSILKDYNEILKSKDNNNSPKTNIQMDLFFNDSYTTYSTYMDFLDIIDTFCCSVSVPNNAINSFDLKDSKQTLKQIESKLKDSIQHKDVQKHTNTNNMQKANTKIKQSTSDKTKTNINIRLLAPKCVKKKFNITKDENLKINTLLYALAKECDFSIQYTHNAKQNLNIQSITLNIIDKGLDFVLKMLLSDMFYTVDSNLLIISDITMKTFEINYISSMRMAQSNTDVLFAQEQDNYGIGYGGFYNNLYSNLPQWQFQKQNAQNSYDGTQSTSGYLDNLSLRNQLRSQMNVANNRFGKSGTKVYSLDEINFWADIESKLQIMLDTKLGDKFMIDKGAGLISVWTTKQKMAEVSQFLQNLEQKMNMQVAIDVEILSLIHFQTNNMGIDWQQIFSILNPTKSNLNISFGGGGAMLTLGNNNADLQSIFNLLRTYGDLRSLSNPKIMAMNNQPALISVGSVLRYTQNLVYQSNNTNTTIQNTSTQYPSVFAGILLDITPSINKNSVILRINPSITKTKDPDMENAAQALNAPPNLSTNQLSSIVKLKDGERVIIGGLLNNVVQNTGQAIPKIGENRWLKNIFGKQNNTNRSEELIIIITPHIIK